MRPTRAACCFSGCLILFFAVAAMACSFDGESARANLRQAERLLSDGNSQEAAVLYRKVLEESEVEPTDVVAAMRGLQQCRDSQGAIGEVDSDLRLALSKHGTSYRVLSEAASQLDSALHYGVVADQQFHRGYDRGYPGRGGVGGRVVFVGAQDWLQSLQWRVRALEAARDAGLADESPELGTLRLQLAQTMLSQRSGRAAWQLTDLTDLARAPDYLQVDGDVPPPDRYAPTNAAGEPILYQAPAEWEMAASDGERIRWAIDQAMKSDSVRPAARFVWATFLQSQFSVETLADQRWMFRGNEATEGNADLAQASVHTLAKDEFLAKLASGVQRFTLKPEQSFIALYDTVAASADDRNADASWSLIQIFLNRRQYPSAAERLRLHIERFAEHAREHFAQQLLDSIVQPRSRFDAAPSQLAGEKGRLSLLFRNATQVQFVARRVDLEKLLLETKTFTRGMPRSLKSGFGGKRNEYLPSLAAPISLFDDQEIDAYVTGDPTTWDLSVEPRENHWDKRIDVETPLTAMGLYVVDARTSVADAPPQSHLARTLLWIHDAALVRHNLADQWLYTLVDARSGKPIAGANLELFGYGYRQDGRPRREQAEIETINRAERTNAQGEVSVQLEEGFNWMAIARAGDGRFALLDFDGSWRAGLVRQTYEMLKAYGVSDRPIYRPGDDLKAKFWVANTTYGDERSTFLAQQAVKVVLSDPQGNRIEERVLTTDEFGGCEFVFALPESTPLGRYSFSVSDTNEQVQYSSALAVRVEEYRKPEFEVNIRAPQKPVALGETIDARIEAKYYFGAPVVDAEVIVRVQRATHRESFYPPFPYDWCYGPGYGWLGGDYRWYPGWGNWRGCLPPSPPWIGSWQAEPAELVLEKELTLDPQGEAIVSIDTALAKALYGDEDHRYTISVEVRDASRRTITAEGSVLASSRPFRIYTWLDRGYYRTGERVVANVQARMLDGTAVQGTGRMSLLRIQYDADGTPREQALANFDVATNDEGYLQQALVVADSGQYRLSTRIDDGAGHEVEGGFIFTVRGPNMDGDNFRYTGLELTPDKVHYAPGETLKLQITADLEDAAVVLFVRPEGGVYPQPRHLQLAGKSSVIEIPITAADQPNFFVEAFTVYGGELHRAVREIYVPPAERVLNVELAADKAEYLPAEKARVNLVVRDLQGNPVRGSCVIAAYDRSLEALAGDVLPVDIREFFWKWQRHHHPNANTNLDFRSSPIYIQQLPYFQSLGIFGESLADDLDGMQAGSRPQLFSAPGGRGAMRGMGGGMGGLMGGAMGGGMRAFAEASPMMAMADGMPAEGEMLAKSTPGGDGSDASAPTVRKDFADSALWLANVVTDADGKGTAEFTMPDNLTGWQIKSWAVGSGTRVGSATTQAVTRKPLMIRLQAPRFLVEQDEVILSALVNNDLPQAQQVRVGLEIDGETQFALVPGQAAEQSLQVPASGQVRVDWRCQALAEGNIVVRCSAISEAASDAMQIQLPILVRGLLKTEAYAGTVRQGAESSTITIQVPAERRVEQSQLTVRLSPSLAASMIDALPYLASYPYDCTEQTLNRFLPTVITHQTLREMEIDLKRLSDQRRNNLNAQELGDATQRRQGWRVADRNAVFDEESVATMVKSGVQRLTELQLADGGWGWFSGPTTPSSPHMTAIVVRGLLIAQQNEVAIVPDVLQRGIDWLDAYQTEQLAKLTAETDDGQADATRRTPPVERAPSNIDALVFHTLVLAERVNPAMQQVLYDQRTKLSVYGKALLAWATHQLGAVEQTAMLRRNLEQFLVVDNQNQTAFLDDDAPWWYWYGSNIEANAIYLKLLSAQEPDGPTAPQVVKYLLNNRKHATYWNSTRDTALVVEAFSDYLRATGELKANMTVEVRLGGKRLGQVQFTPENLFEVDNSIVIAGNAVPAGEQALEIRRLGSGNLYWNAYLANFTLEQEIAPAGLEVAIERRFYLLEAETRELSLPDANAQATDRQRLTYRRTLLEDLQEVPSGALVEVELLVQSRNDYEYLLIEDRKPAGLEAVETQSGYFYEAGLSIYRELRDAHIGLCIEHLPKGNYSIRYQLRSEAPGTFTGLPATIEGMYAPELVGNSADYDLRVVD